MSKSKYGHRQIDWFEDVIDKLGGEKNADALLGGDLAVQLVGTKLLRRISDGASLFFSACDGSETIADAHDVFKFGIDSDFKMWGLSGPSKATRKTPAEVYELLKEATVDRMFTFLSPSDLGVLCVTQHQIKKFCKKYHDWICAEGYETLFLTKKNWKAPADFGNLFVVFVLAISDDLRVRTHRVWFDRTWYADNHFRLVVPQLVV